MHEIILHRNAVKFYRKADDTLKERVADAIDVIARNPRLDGHIKKLKGDLKHMHRFRMGDLCILYEIDDAQEIVWIKTIEWRGSAYK
ncbi:MAG TPA: type II toxin-antitoxin system RelE/ParE family toxin [Syntrophus sp. (in: bacteria)]|nr:type II toxin-antitoxin system RelE/ParE family toxin [Syntrophus sp. (in: bacteria)]